MSKERAPKETLLRLALDPDGKPFVDLLARAPGRGVYVAAEELVRSGQDLAEFDMLSEE